MPSRRGATASRDRGHATSRARGHATSRARGHATSGDGDTADPRRVRWRVPLAVAVLGYLGTLAVNRSLVEVRGPSMEPTLWAGDRLLTVPALRRWVRPGRVVVVTDPADASHLTVKRVASAEAGRVMVLGDDPVRSTDSRTWGPVPIGSVRRVVLRRWPDLRTRLER